MVTIIQKSIMRVVGEFSKIVFFLSLAQSASFPPLTPSSQVSTINYRLPDNIVPISYKIFLRPNLDGEKFEFTGESKISVNVKKRTNVITLHANSLEIQPGVTVECGIANKVEVMRVEPINITTDFLKIILNEKLQTGTNCTLSLKYIGQGGENYGGFYRTAYKTSTGEKKWMASNSFHQMGARKVFPCWDEPTFKANFRISIEHHKKYTALSNMHVVKKETSPQHSQWIITHFAQSPKMSVYLVAFTISQFVQVDSHNEIFRVWVPEDLIEAGKYASIIGPRIIQALEEYTNFTYRAHGLEKMDAFPVRLPLEYIAIEDWGLVRYQRRGLLYFKKSNQTSQKEYVTKIMAHELAHQWFGNLVTAEWFDYIWLNEGFANYFQYAIPNQIEPTWRMMDRYVLENIQSGAFLRDSRSNSHAMEQIRQTPDEVRDAYDSITYKKSGSIIRMMSHVLGEGKFKTGLRNYLKAKAYTAVTSADLFEEFAKLDTSNTNLLKIFKNWVTVPGYPVITVTRNYEIGKATVTQSRFLNDKSTARNESYWVPLNYANEDNMNFTDTSVTHWFDPSKNFIEIDGLKNNQFVIFNKQQFGYYRVNYDAKNWELIINYLNTDKYTNIHVLNRAQVIDDALNLAKAGYLKFNVVLSLIGYLKRETDFIPWSTAWRVIEELYNIVKNTELKDQFKNYVLELSAKLVKEVLSLRLNQVDEITALKRHDTLKWACSYGSHSCRTEAANKLIKWLDDSIINALSPDDRNWLLCAGIRDANQSTWNRLQEKYTETQDTHLLIALSCSSNIKILNTFLSNTIAESHIFMRLPLLFMSIEEKSHIGASAVLEFIIDRYNDIIALDGFSSDHLKFQLTHLGGQLTTHKQYEMLQQFIESNKMSLNGAGDMALEAARNHLSNLNNNSTWKNEFEEFFRTKNSPII